MTEEFRRLPDTYEFHGNSMVLEERNDEEKYVVYKCVKGLKNYYEVFKIKECKATTINMGGKISVVPRREKLPSENSFGVWAWACNGTSSRNKAVMKIIESNKTKK